MKPTIDTPPNTICDTSDYAAIAAAEQRLQAQGQPMMRVSATERFQEIHQRKDHSALPEIAIRQMSCGKFHHTWRGVRCMKDPLDLALYNLLLAELRPKTVLEIGCYAGGGALWLADQADVQQLPMQIHSLDRSMEWLHPLAAQDERIHFIKGDCESIHEALDPTSLQSWPHPWMIIEDAHVNLSAVLEHLHNHGLQAGDYLIVEDTNPYIPAGTDASGLTPDYAAFGLAKMKAVREFIEQHPDDYRVDSHYCDYYGYNTTWNWNSFLKRI